MFHVLFDVVCTLKKCYLCLKDKKKQKKIKKKKVKKNKKKLVLQQLVGFTFQSLIYYIVGRGQFIFKLAHFLLNFFFLNSSTFFLFPDLIIQNFNMHTLHMHT
uniref:Uncharacterized protein n=1 Tax=Cacopsylla melanoneura TaxID=428564 RepID=A0A8D9FBP5_9HEMI